MAVATNELDPMFVKALDYLWSKSPDSTAKLKRMLDDAIEQSLKKKQDVKSNIDKSLNVKTGKHSVKIVKTHDTKKKEKDSAQKRQFEKIQKDLLELDQEVSKKSRLDSQSPAFLSNDKFRSGNESKRSPLASDDKDYAIEMDELACVVCKGFSNDKGNTIECQECHNWYHRDCHQPPISEDANDPRCLWNCSVCTKKVAKQISSKPSTVARPNLVRDNSFEPKNKSAFVTPFKRNEIKSTLQSSGNGSVGGSLSGWAALSGKTIPQPSATTKQVKPTTSGVLSSKEKRDKSTKMPKVGPKLAVSDAFAEALGADLPTGMASSSKSSSHKSNPSSWISTSKSSMFPKAAATTSLASAEKRFQNMKKKAKLNSKKSKI
ncbi:integrator complex subunit 12-like [Styela clava]